MRRKSAFFFMLAVVCVAGLALAPATASAQHGRVHPGGGRVYVGVGLGAWGYPYWGWGPYWAWGWGPYWGGPGYYAYPWGYYPGPIDDSASLKLEVKPKDAQVYVDGNYAGVVDDFDGIFQKLHVPPGDHELVLYKTGFRTVKQSVRLRRGQDVKVHYTLQPLAAGETAEPPPPPQKREEPQYQAPRRGEPQSRAPRYPAPPRRAPEPGEQAPSSGVEARAFGALVLRVQPEGAEILIDGERWQGPEGEDRLVVQVSEGSHRVEIRKEGFKAFTTEVTVRAGETTPLNVSLPRVGEVEGSR